MSPRYYVEVSEHWSGWVEGDSEAEVQEMAEEIAPDEMGLLVESEDVYVRSKP